MVRVCEILIWLNLQYAFASLCHNASDKAFTVLCGYFTVLILLFVFLFNLCFVCYCRSMPHIYWINRKTNICLTARLHIDQWLTGYMYISRVQRNDSFFNHYVKKAFVVLLFTYIDCFIEFSIYKITKNFASISWTCYALYVKMQNFTSFTHIYLLIKRMSKTCVFNLMFDSTFWSTGSLPPAPFRMWLHSCDTIMIRFVCVCVFVSNDLELCNKTDHKNLKSLEARGWRRTGSRS
jgi:hypothetical protein